jgi:hypothetical protein
LGTAGGRSHPARVAGPALASCRARRERGGTRTGGSCSRSRLVRGAEGRVTAAAGSRRAGSGAGLPPRQGPGRGPFSFLGSTPCAGSIRPSSAASTRSNFGPGFGPGFGSSFGPGRGASIWRGGARSGIGPRSAARGWGGRPRTRCGARLASATRSIIFLRPARSPRRGTGCRLPRRAARSGWCLPSCAGRGRGGGRLRRRRWCGPTIWFRPAEDRSGCGRESGRQIRASRCLDLSRPGSLRQGSFRLCGSRGGSQPGELRQTVFQEVVGLRVHGEGMDLARGRQAAHRFPHP